jgi:chorismate dehydratase
VRPLRIGKIAYTNLLPVVHHFKEEGLPIEWVPLVPADLNRLLREGQIDLAPISAFAYGLDFEQYQILPHLSISSRGTVHSILLFSRYAQLADLSGKRIALTNASATSVHLLKLLLERCHGITSEYFVTPPDLQQMMRQADAALLIGDDALCAQWQNTDYHVFDLGEEWWRETNQSMTYSLWAVREEVAALQSKPLTQVNKRLQAAKEEGRKRLDEVITEARRRLGGPVAFWKKYYQALRYDFGEEEQSGLMIYFQWAYEQKYLPHAVPLKIMNDEA